MSTRDDRGSATDTANGTEKAADRAFFSLEGRVAVVTGGYGVLGGTLATGLAAAGARVAVVARRAEAAEAHVATLRHEGREAMAVVADVLDERQVQDARDQVLSAWEQVDILVNAAGGNVPGSRNDDRSIFEVPPGTFDDVLRLNLHGTVTPSLGSAKRWRRAARSIVNISSMASFQALSGVLGYSIAKAGIDAFTRWLAVDLARRYGDGVRVNAIAPGFFVSKQNQGVLVQPDGRPTDRARTILDLTPMGRFGRPEELVGAVQWLASDAASFVTGVVIPVAAGSARSAGCDRRQRLAHDAAHHLGLGRLDQRIDRPQPLDVAPVERTADAIPRLSVQHERAFVPARLAPRRDQHVDGLGRVVVGAAEQDVGQRGPFLRLGERPGGARVRRTSARTPASIPPISGSPRGSPAANARQR
jgi:NAD(P)-dependent dehydrogenase (short-subunit alcohol dehydrogenase family)